ncbi:MAG: ABC transporter ATP-binding protein/permease [Butyrivibrio sp.]|nr:ABC transporter ATP-binding protein/permease [Butyrivibrio sp.]
MNEKEKPKYNTLQNVWWMLQVAWKAGKRAILFCILTATLEVTYNLVQLYIAPRVLLRIEQKAPISMLLLTIGLFTAALFVVQGLKSYVGYNTLFPRVDVRSAIISKVTLKSNITSYSNTLSEDFQKKRDKAYQATNDNEEATEEIWETLTSLLTNVGGLIVYLLILSKIDAVLLLVIIATCFAGFLVSRYTNNWQYAHRDEEEKYYIKKSYIRRKAESVELAKDIRIFGLQNWLNELLDKVHDAYLAYAFRCEKVEVLAEVVEAVLTMARNGIAYFYLIKMTLNEGLSVSEFVLYFTAVTTFTSWVMGVLKELSKLHKHSMDISRLREYLDYPEPFKFEDGEKIPEYEEFELQLSGVSFRYPGASEDTIHDINLTVHPGEKLAIVGLNGAGKTTLVKLLCGLLDPTEGRVLLNGKDIREFNRREYYRLFSAVFQEFSILDVTVAEEIAQTKEDIDYDKVRKCIDMAGLSSNIDKLPKGLETHIGREVYLDGVLFSGGETQRLMLARALYKDGPILLLDEPTAALDPIAENDMYMKYGEMSEGKTSLFISHRLAATRFCDRIIFVADGGIKEEGTHENLINLGGEYAQLFEVQSRYYQEGKEF